jgi:putative tricarboxylic transport membrane protein
MDVLQHLMDGFAAALTLRILLYALAGCVLGTLVGALPAFGPAAGIALLLPLVFVIPPDGGLVMMGAIYYGNMYGNTISSVLINMPGDAASVMTCIDGNMMMKQGRAGVALGMAAIASFIAGTVSNILLTFLGPGLAAVAVKFGPAEYFGVVLVGLAAVAALTGKAPEKGYLMAVLGLMLSMIGLDATSYQHRLTFGSVSLMDGIGFNSAIVGMFGLAQVFINLENPVIETISSRGFWLRDVWPSWVDWQNSWKAIIRGTVIGFPVGVLPGAGAAIATFLAYAYQKKHTHNPELMGKGAIDGVAAPEAANNAAAVGAFVPMLSLGVPGSNTTAVLLAALIMWGLQPGPLLFEQHPEVLWPFVASMYIGNVLLVIINMGIIPVFVWMLNVSQRYINAFVGVFAIVGVYCVNNDAFDVWLMMIFGVLGYIFEKVDYPVPPFILAFVLGPIAEESLQRALAISGGSFAIFVTRPISASLIAIVAFMVIWKPLIGYVRQRRAERSATPL